MNSNKTRYLFCFDFDLTITKQHLHHYIHSQIKSHVSRETSCLNALQILAQDGVKNKDILWDQIYSILLLGHGIAITSFTAFPELPLAFLSKGIRGLRKMTDSKDYDHYLCRPIVIYGPADSSILPPFYLAHTYYVNITADEIYQQGKCQHIHQALKIFQSKDEYFDQVVLIDDDINNIEKARQNGYVGIHVSSEGEEGMSDSHDYLQHIQKLLCDDI